MGTAERRRSLACTVLALAAGGQALVGLGLPFTYRSALFAWHRVRVAEALYGTAELPADALPILGLFSAMLGGTMAAWGVTVAWLAHGPLRRGERWAGWAITTSLLAWFPLDTGLSAAQGAGVNVVFNIGAALMIVAPLVAAWPHPPGRESSAGCGG